MKFTSLVLYIVSKHYVCPNKTYQKVSMLYVTGCGCPVDTPTRSKHRPRRQPRPPSRILIVLLISFITFVGTGGLTAVWSLVGSEYPPDIHTLPTRTLTLPRLSVDFRKPLRAVGDASPYTKFSNRDTIIC